MKKYSFDFCNYINDSLEEQYHELSNIIVDLQNSNFFRSFMCLKYNTADLYFKSKYRASIYIEDNNPKNVYYSICCIVKNETKNIIEFIEFHRLVGAEKIYIIDNGSTDDLRKLLNKYIASGYVAYIYFPGEKVQTAAYRYVLNYCKHLTYWLAFIDCDEFLFSPQGDFKSMLKRYDAFPGIGVNWVMYGPCGHIKRPDGLTISNYTKTYKDKNHFYNCRIKSIVQPSKVELICSPHFAYYKNEDYAVDEDMNIIDGRAAFKPGLGRAFTVFNHRKVFRINHYVTRSEDDLREKCLRGYPDGHANAVFEDELALFENVKLVEDKEICKFANELKEVLGIV